MSKNVKQAELALTDAGKFPIETCREKLARRYGEDSVALSGPFEGKKLAEAVCKSLSARWDRLEDRFAKNEEKLTKLAFKLADSYKSADDSKDCETLLGQKGYTKEASSEITGYLKAYFMPKVARDEIMTMADEIATEDEGVMDELSGLDEDVGGFGQTEEVLPPTEEVLEPGLEEGLGEEPPIQTEIETEEEVTSPAPEAKVEVNPEEGTLEIEVPLDTVQSVINSPEAQAPMEEVPSMEEESPMGEEPSIEDEEVSFETFEDEDGLPEDEMEEEEETELPPGKSEEEGHQVARSGEGQSEQSEDSKPPFMKKDDGEKRPERKEDGSGKEKEHEKHEEHEEHEPREEKKEEEKEGCMASSGSVKVMSSFPTKTASKVQKTAEEIRRLGPEMSLNNTDQLGGHSDKQLGKAKEKEIGKPKPISEGNVEVEGHSAGGTTYQDGKTMGKEQKFDAKDVNRSEFMGGKKSIMGPKESYPENTPKVPAGSAPIGGEQFTGGDVATKGTVIAFLTPNGVLIQTPEGKKYLGKIAIEKPTEKMAKSISEIEYDGDGVKFAKAAVRAVKAAVEDETKTNSGEVEGKLVNDPEVEDEKTPKAKTTDKTDSEGITKTDTSELEGKHFQNNPGEEEKEKSASTKANVKTADVKQIEAPKAISEGNFNPEGHSAGGSKFQDGKTLGNEEKFDAKPVNKKDVTGGDKSLLGKDESYPKDAPKVPVGGGQMGEEEFKGDNVETLGTVRANSSDSEKRQAEIIKEMQNEAKVRELRIKHASLLVADLLLNGEIKPEQYVETLDKYAAYPVQVIQSLAKSTRETRERVKAAHQPRVETRTVPAPLTQAVVLASTNPQETSLKDQLVKSFKLTRELDRLAPEEK